MTDCIFCKIIAGEIPAEVVYKNEHTFAFLDINPNNFGHTLVLPKQHHENIFDMPPAVVCEVYTTVQKIARALEKIGAEGVNIIANNNIAAGQIVFHAHVHVIPRKTDDGFTHWPQKKYENTEHIQETAKKISHALE